MPESNWSQDQQQLLELAIVKYPKTGSSDRWQKIANNVPGKTREECLARYRHLCEIVKAQKLKNQPPKDNTDVATENDSVDTNRNVEDQEAINQSENYELDNEPVKNKGKPKNKRKERKQKMELSSDEEIEYEH